MTGSRISLLAVCIRSCVDLQKTSRMIGENIARKYFYYAGVA